MEIIRDIISKLAEWKKSKTRKPLILSGARQIGKTWALKEFGRLHYDNVAYFNFDKKSELQKEFEATKDPRRLVKALSLYVDCEIKPENTLIIFDEIQECNKALNSLKYFCEDAPEYHIVCAGSLLGVFLSKGDSFPVGKIEFLNMYPLTFKEFLYHDNKKMHDFAETIDKVEPIPEIAMKLLEESYRRYLVCGGMPEAAISMLENNGNTDKILSSIIEAYRLDFSKHAPSSDIQKIADIWNSMPTQLSKENRKFQFKFVKSSARYREYESAMLWLQNAGLILRVNCITKPGLPISAYEDSQIFKVYLNDVGLMRVLAQLPPNVYMSDNAMFKEFKGAMTENYVLQSLVANFEVMPRYWMSSGTAEVDFVLQDGLNILPIEVKSGTSISGKSIKVFGEKYSSPLMLRFSGLNLRCDNNFLNIPLWLVDYAPKFLERIAASR